MGGKRQWGPKEGDSTYYNSVEDYEPCEDEDFDYDDGDEDDEDGDLVGWEDRDEDDKPERVIIKERTIIIERDKD